MQRRNPWTAAVGTAALALALGVEAPAFAFGLGSSVGIGFGDSAGFPPSFDLVLDPAIIQIHVLQTLDAAVDDQLYLGANVYFEAEIAPVGGPWYATVQPGFSLDLLGDPTTVVVAAEARLGLAAEDDAGFGVYVVPALGISASDGNTDLLAGGALQISVWFGL
ncbi:MAG: hypothetical protein R3F59_06880 [Myxococcota bacterium]